MKLTVDMIMIQPPLLNNNVNVTQVPNEKEQELQEVWKFQLRYSVTLSQEFEVQFFHLKGFW